MTRLPWISVTEAAHALSVRRQKVLYAIWSGALLAKRLGTTWAIHEDDLVDYIERSFARRRAQQLRYRCPHHPGSHDKEKTP